MGRVEQGGGGGGRPPSVGPGAQRHHKQLTDSAKPTYKVIIEEVTQARRPLRLEDYHSIDPPHGYRFVPAGDPSLTTKCKELARLDGKLVYAVTTIDKDKTELSKQVHRVGFHFPSEVVQRALTSLGIDLDREDDVLRTHEIWPVDNQRRDRRGRPIKNAGSSKRNLRSQPSRSIDFSTMTQEQVDAQAKAAILDMFPAIPHENLYQIILHSFELGTDKVGVQLNELSLPRRIQLAVVAHIRHVYTDYDNLLHRTSWPEARATVAPKTLEVLASWRGDKDDDIDVVEDILREVIVISDDEDEMSASTTQAVNISKQSSGITKQQGNMSVVSVMPSSIHLDTGRSDKVGARRQIWLDARERRREPTSAHKARENHSYYIPRPGHEAPVNIDQKMFEQRLRGLQNHSQQYSSSNRQSDAANSQSASYLRYDQVPLQHKVPVNSSHHRPDYVRQVNAESRSGQVLRPEHNMSRNHSSNPIHTPQQSKTTPKSKLELLPVNDDVLPSIETPRTERGPASSFPRGAIHIDSPPPEPRAEYNHLRRQPDNPSPIKRKREVSPMPSTGNSPREIVYLPIREDGARFEGPRTEYSRRSYAEPAQIPMTDNRIVYLPLDENNNFKPYSRPEIDYLPPRTNSQQSTSQVYLDSPGRPNGHLQEVLQSPGYRYIPLGPVQQKGPSEASREQYESPRTRLIPLDVNRESQSGYRISVAGSGSRTLIPLGPESPQSARTQTKSNYGTKYSYPPAEAIQQQSFTNHQVQGQSQRYPTANIENMTHQIRSTSGIQEHEPIPYDPHDPRAGISQHPFSTQQYHEHRRKDSGLR